MKNVKILGMVVGGALCVLVGPVLSLLVGVSGAWVPEGQAAPSAAIPVGAVASVPTAMLRIYPAAATACPGLPWQVLAAIGTVESGNGTSDLPGVHRGANASGAEGPMQFEPATFVAYARPVPPGGAVPPTPYDPVDAAYAAARMLCAAGATRSGGLGGALFDYNHSTAYVAQVLAVAGNLGLGPDQPGPPAIRALDYALAQVGTPYRWGGEVPGVGFDCSGLVQAAYAVAGVALPRVAAEQMQAGPAVRPTQALAPGDLVFFGPAPGQVSHVGLVVDPSGVMVDAPHTGAEVRVEGFPTVVGQAWGDDVYLGATAPAGGGGWTAGGGAGGH